MKRQHQLRTMLSMGLVLASSALFATPASGAGVRLNVKDELNKDRDSSKTESDKSSSRTTTETLTYELDIQVSNTTKQEDTFDIEWYFIKRPFDSKGKKGDPILCEKDKTTLTIGGQKRASHKAASKTISNSESKSSKSSSSNSSSSSSGSSKSFSGDTYAGYVVLVRHQGEIVAKYSNENKFTSEVWLEKLDGPVQKSPARKASTSTKKKNKKKK